MRKCILLAMVTMFAVAASASNLVVSNSRIDQVKVVKVGDEQRDTAIILFDISWDHSWRDSENWDAAWVFVKYYDVSECAWHHCWLCPTAGTFGVGRTNGREPVMTIEKSYCGAAVNGSESREQRGIGAFLFNKNETPGDGVSNNWQNVKVSWLMGDQGVAKENVQYIKVFAIEMVFVPTAQFDIGDGNKTFTLFSDSGTERFDCANTGANRLWAFITPRPFLVTGDAIPEGMFYVYAQSCNYRSGGRSWLGRFKWDSWDGNHHYGVSYESHYSGTCNLCNGGEVYQYYTWLPITYPLGYRAFYCMKTEVSQQLYTEFLNTLPFRVEGYEEEGTDDGHPRYPNKYLQNRFNIKRTSEKFICDANNDNVGDQFNDGQWIACNWMNWQDCEAFADWAGLRPMTELEFEKACRGPMPHMVPVLNEYAWGTNTIVPPDQNTPIDNSLKNTINEQMLINNQQGKMPNCVYMGDDPAWKAQLTGPTISGQFARNSTSRQAAGATYYGILDMSGNVWEACLSVYLNASSAHPNHTFRYDAHGDGELTAACAANAFLSTAYNGQKYGQRGGGWDTYGTNESNVDVAGDANGLRKLTISGGYRAANGAPRTKSSGFRCVRSAEDHMNL